MTVWLVVAAALSPIIVATIIGAFDSTPLAGYDAKADWLVTTSAFEGRGPYDSVELLARRYDVAMSSFAGVPQSPHPRLPSAVLLMAPLTLLSSVGSHLVLMLVSGLLALWVLGWSGSRFDSLLPALAVALLTSISAPVIATFQFGTQSLIIAGLMLVVLMDSEEETRPLSSGLALGLATALKVFPGIVVIPLVLRRRYRTAGVAVCVAVVLNIIGAAALHIGPAEVVGALQRTSDAWSDFRGNASAVSFVTVLGLPTTLASAVVPLAAVTCVVWLAAKGWTAQPLVAFATVLGVAASPLSWVHYQVIAIPVLALLWITANSGVSRFLTLAWAAVWIVIVPLSREIFVADVYRMLLVVGALIPPAAVFIGYDAPSESSAWRS